MAGHSDLTLPDDICTRKTSPFGTRCWLAQSLLGGWPALASLKDTAGQSCKGHQTRRGWEMQGLRLKKAFSFFLHVSVLIPGL